MTSTALAPPAVQAASEPPDVASAPTATGRPSPWSERVEWAAYAVVVLIWAFYVLPARGGWEQYVVPTACLALLPSLLVLRPWRNCSPSLMVLASAPALGAVVVAAASPYGDGGPISLSRWGWFAGVLVATAAFARTPNRRAGVVVAVLLVGLQQYASGWLAWWGGGDTVDGPMLGTIYSANPFGSLMLGFALCGAAVALLAPVRLRRLGWVTAPLCACGVALSASRLAMLLLVCGVLLLTVLAARAHGPRGVLRAGALIAVTWAVLTVSTSSIFFTGGEDQDALAATSQKGQSGQTLDSTTGVRFEYWSAAWGQFRDDPLLGAGSGSYMGNSRLRMPAGAERSPFAHNEVLGALAEGGLPLGVPVLAVFVVGLVLPARRVWSALVRPAPAGDLWPALAVGVAAVLVHALADFALVFPAILGLVAVLMGACGVSQRRDPGGSRAGAGTATLAVVAVLLGGAYLGFSHDRSGVSSAAPASTSPLPGLRDGRVVLAEARAALVEPGRDVARARGAERAVAELAPYDGNVELMRLRLVAASGRPGEALSGTRELAARSAAAAPLLLLPYAEMLADSGRRDDAFDLLAGHVHQRAAESGRVRRQLLELLDQARRIAGTQEPGWSCTVQALLDEGVPADTPALAGSVSLTTDDRCTAWAARSADLLGDSA